MILLFWRWRILFCPGYDDEGHIVMQPRTVRLWYLRTYAVPDVLAALPWDMVLLLARPSGVAAYLLRAPRLVRLCKLPQALQYLSR